MLWQEKAKVEFNNGPTGPSYSQMKFQSITVSAVLSPDQLISISDIRFSDGEYWIMQLFSNLQF